MKESDTRDQAFCRHCGGIRWHDVIAKEDLRWDDDEAPVSSFDSWQILRCRGCETVGFRHIHWFSEDTDGEGNAIIHTELYPPAAIRRQPDWQGWPLHYLRMDELWADQLLEEIQKALGLRSFSLVAMGARTIVDWIVTKKAGDGGKFVDKLKRMEKAGLITSNRVEVISAVFDAGSAAAHRGYQPDETQVSTMLEVMEGLLFDFVVKPHKDRHQEEEAKRLKAQTPPRERASSPKAGP